MAIKVKTASVLEDNLEPLKENIAEMTETHTVIRAVSGVPDGVNSFSMAQVDDYLNVWLKEGWRILNTHYLGNPPEGWILAWVLVR